MWVFVNERSFARFIPYQRAETEQDFSVTFPPLLWAVSFKARKLTKSQLWVIKAGMETRLSTTSTDNALACFPYGNVYAHGGVCWGTTRLNDVKQPGDVHEAFFASDFNGDLYTRQYINVREDGLFGYLTRITGAGRQTSVLNLPIESLYTKSVAAVVQDIVRG